ncbi:hypothetical protein PENTCL1PPCAC_20637, partial [Pristionchus entomophagus]
AQLESLDDKSRAAKNAPRKFVERDTAPLDSLVPQLKDCKQKLAESLKKAEDEEKDKFILAIALQLQKLAEETPIDSVPLEKLDDLEKQLAGVDSPAARDQLEAIKKLRKKRAENDHLRDKVLDAVAKAKDSTKKIEDDVKSSSPDSAAKGKKGKKSKKDSSPGVEAPLADQIAALEKHVRDINDSIVPSIDAALALPVDAPAEKKDAEKARQNAQDLAARLADDINSKKDELDNQNKARSVEDALAKIGDKIDSVLAPYKDKPQSQTKAEADIQKIADLLVKDLAAVPIDQLADPSSAAATAAKLKQKAKEQVAPIEKEIEAEKKLAADSDTVETQAAQLEKDLDSVRNKTDDPAAAIAAIADIADRARKLRPTAEAVEIAYDSPRSSVAHAAPKPDLVSRLDNLLAEADRANSQQNEAAQIAALAPEIEKMHELVMTKADEAVPEALVDQQSNLEDLEGRRKKLEDIIAGLPESGPGVDELRAKSEWDLSKLKDLLKKLGDAVGDKMAALAAWNALRKGAEAQLVDLTKEKPVPKDAAGLEKAVDDLANDEKALEALAQSARDGVNADDLDDDEKKKRDDLLNQIEKALALIKARKAAAEKALKDAQDSDKLAADLSKIDSRLAPLVEEATRLLQDPDAIPSAYTSTAKDLKAAIDEARPIVDAARSSKDPAVKKLAASIKKAEKVTPLLEDRFKKWNEFVDDREVANNLLDNFRDDLAAKEREDAGLSIEEAEKQLADLEAMSGDLEKLKETGAELEKLAEGLNPLYQPLQDARFFIVDAEAKENDYFNALQRLDSEIKEEHELKRNGGLIADEIAKCKENIVTDEEEGAQSIPQTTRSLLGDIEAHLQDAIDTASKKPRRYVDPVAVEELKKQLEEVKDLEQLPAAAEPAASGEEEEDQEHEPQYDLDAAAEVMAALYPGRSPREVLREHGIDGVPSESETETVLSMTDDESRAGDTDGFASPVPDDADEEQLRRQRGRWRRVLRTALPLQAMLVLLLGAACLVPHCDDDYCCQLLNNFARSLDPALQHLNPPPF